MNEGLGEQLRLAVVSASGLPSGYIHMPWFSLRRACVQSMCHKFLGVLPWFS